MATGFVHPYDVSKVFQLTGPRFTELLREEEREDNTEKSPSIRVQIRLEKIQGPTTRQALLDENDYLHRAGRNV